MSEKVERAIILMLAAGILVTSAAITVKALRAMREIVRISNRRRAGQCLACGYDLTGNASGTCPECGATAR